MKTLELRLKNNEEMIKVHLRLRHTFHFDGWNK